MTAILFVNGRLALARQPIEPEKGMTVTPTASPGPRLYLIDGSAYVYRAYHAIRGLSNSKGLPTNAVFGFTRMILKLLDEGQPSCVGICFDAKGPTFRHRHYPAYKANRPPMPEDLVVQLPYIRAVAEGFNVASVELEGYEADDLIGTLARQAQDQGYRVVMVTGDKDFIQLVTEKAVIWDPMKEKTIDAQAVRDLYGLTPSHFADVLGLAGDASDNIPGVSGIGMKTAVELIGAFGSMEELYARLDTLSRKKQRENLVQFKDRAFLSRQLATIDTDAPVCFDPQRFALREPDRRKLADLFGELEFRQFQAFHAPPPPAAPGDYRCISNWDELDDLVAQIRKAGLVALDTETTGVDPMRAMLVGLSFAVAPHQAFYIPCGHDYPGAPAQLPLDLVLAHLKPVLEDPGIAKVGQNIKYDWIMLARNGVALAGVAFDTMLASYLLDPSRRSHSLDQIALEHLGRRTITYAEVAGKGHGFNAAVMEKAVPYACQDADLTLQAYHILGPQLEQAGLTDLMDQVELPLVPVLKAMEMRGIAVDRQRLQALSIDFAARIGALEAEIHRMAGQVFNVNSPQQLAAILFDTLKLPIQKKTRKKTAYSTDVDVLTSLAEKHPLPGLILEHRSLTKLKSTYADALVDLIHPVTGRIHTSFNQTVAATGRLSSSDPNLQNIPVRTPEGRQIRQAFIPRQGWTLLSADYSQIELRILAHCADDPILIKAFTEHQDIHTRTAAEIFQVFPEMVTDDLRRQAKVINFGIIYGMSPFGLSKALGISQKMAKVYIDHYFARYQGVRAYIDVTIAAARQSGHSLTLLGRVRPLPDINSANQNLRQFAERTAVNTPIQGTAADLIKLAMIRVEKALEQAGLHTAMLLSVHDEIVFEVAPTEIDRVKDLVKSQMEGVWDLKVPLEVNLATGANWAEAH